MDLAVFLIVLGAILYWAINATVAGIDLSTVGVILMVVGGIYGLYCLIVGRSFWVRRR